MNNTDIIGGSCGSCGQLTGGCICYSKFNKLEIIKNFPPEPLVDRRNFGCPVCRGVIAHCTCLGSIEIDVFDKIKPFLKFESEDDFYFLQILQRKKENPQLGSNSRVIKNYYIRNIEYLENKYNEIKDLCRMFNARAMLRLNKRSFKKVGLKALQNMANGIANGENIYLSKAYDRACGQGHNDKVKKWIIDIDGDYNQSYIDEVIQNISDCEPNSGENKILVQLPTRNGVHLITTPFNLKKFSEYGWVLDIHKDNPVNVFIP